MNGRDARDDFTIPEPEAERRKHRPKLSDHPLVQKNGRARSHRVPWNKHGKVGRRKVSE